MNDHIRKRITGSWCVYCGEHATTDEHFPPQACGNDGWIIPACSECNSLANTEWPYNFEERCNYVKEKINKRYPQKVLSTLDDMLKLEDKEWLAAIDLLNYERLRRRRLAWSATVYLNLIAPSSVTALSSAKITSTINSVRTQQKPGKQIKVDKLYSRDCEYCNRIFSSRKALASHKISCHKNPDRIKSQDWNGEFCKSWLPPKY